MDHSSFGWLGGILGGILGLLGGVIGTFFSIIKDSPDFFDRGIKNIFAVKMVYYHLDTITFQLMNIRRLDRIS
jgi:hypothetical protein